MIREACFKITEDCPCYCSFCDSRYKFNEVLKRKTMALEEWKAICGKLINQGIQSVVISGGEPLMHIELSRGIITYLRDRDIYVVLNTSGVLFNDTRILEKIIETSPNLIVFSVDSCTAEKHDINRRMPGLFQKVVKSINYLKEKSNISVGIRTVITKNNFRELLKILTDFGRFGVDCIKLTNIENDTEGIYRLDYEELLEFNNIVRPKMHKALQTLCTDDKTLENNINNVNGIFGKTEDYPTIAQGLFSPAYTGKCQCCLQGHFITVQSNGDILPCCEAEHHYYPILGNVMIDDIESIISADSFQQFLNNRLEYCVRCTQTLNYQLSFAESTRIVERR